MRRSDHLIAALLSASLATMGGRSYLAYRHDMREIRRRLQNCSRVIQTAAGPIEYAEQGRGQPVLVIHGATGGYDQGIKLTRLLSASFCCITISRFGYLRTPLPVDASPETQADAYAALLDALDIERVAIVGASAGGPSSLLFALRHPHRCAALILVSAISQALPIDYPALSPLLRLFIRSDYATWLILHAASPLAPSLLGASRPVQQRMTPADRRWLLDYWFGVLPFSLRQAGILHDVYSLPYLPRHPLEQIHKPALVVHAADDQIVPIWHGLFSRDKIPGAQSLILPDGGHLMLTHHQEVTALVTNFLDKHRNI